MSSIYFMTLIDTLMVESRLLLAHIMLYFRQHIYAYWLIRFLDSILTKDILLIILLTGDINVRSENQSELDFILANTSQIITYNLPLAYQVRVRFDIYSAKFSELFWTILCSVFLVQIIIEDKNQVIFEVKS